jgi:predicted Zn-dependent protease
VTADRAVDLASDVVGAVVADAPGADAEVTVEHAEQALTRFANSAIHQNVVDRSRALRLRLHHHDRTVTLSTNRTDADGQADLVARALEAVRSGPLDPGWPGVAPASKVPPPADGPGVGAAAERARAVRAFVDAAGGLETAGYCKATRTDMAFANSAGHRATSVSSAAAFDGIARHHGHDGVARVATTTLADIDANILGTRAAAKAMASANPVELPAGRYPVVLEPAAAADLLWALVAAGFNGRAVAERQSFVEVGASQFDPAITLVDDAPAYGVTFDADGTPTGRLVLVDAGTTAALTHDRRTAREVGATSSGHATGSGPFGPVAAHAALLPAAVDDSVGAVAVGDPPGFVDPAASGLLAGVERGVLVSDFWYTRVLDPRALVLTGLTRNGVWLVENGVVTTPIKNFRFTQAYPAALAPGAVLAVGSTATGLTESWFGARWSVPALSLASWNFTGGASG